MKFEQRMKAYALGAGALGLVLALGFFFGSGARTQGISTSPLLAGVDFSKVTVVKIADYQLMSKVGTWVASSLGEDFPAQSDKVDALFTLLKDLKKLRTVSSSGTDSDKYGFSTTQGFIILQDSQGKDLGGIEVGSPLENGKQIYVRLSGLPAVYVTDRSLLNQISQNVHQWTDLTVLKKLEEKQVSLVEWKGNLKISDQEFNSFTVMRSVKDGKETWMKGQEVLAEASSKISQMLRTRGQENGRANQNEFSTSAGVLTIQAGTEKIIITIGTPNDRSLYPVTVQGRRLWLSEYAVKDLLLN